MREIADSSLEPAVAITPNPYSSLLSAFVQLFNLEQVGHKIYWPSLLPFRFRRLGNSVLAMPRQDPSGTCGRLSDLPDLMLVTAL
jgi:hypothetical protein